MSANSDARNTYCHPAAEIKVHQYNDELQQQTQTQSLIFSKFAIAYTAEAKYEHSSAAAAAARQSASHGR